MWLFVFFFFLFSDYNLALFVCDDEIGFRKKRNRLAEFFVGVVGLRLDSNLAVSVFPSHVANDLSSPLYF